MLIIEDEHMFMKITAVTITLVIWKKNIKKCEVLVRWVKKKRIVF